MKDLKNNLRNWLRKFFHKERGPGILISWEVPGSQRRLAKVWVTVPHKRRK